MTEVKALSRFYAAPWVLAGGAQLLVHNQCLSLQQEERHKGLSEYTQATHHMTERAFTL